jgi:hypothetical protein
MTTSIKKSPIDFVTAMGRLLSDLKLRNQHRHSPETLAKDLNVADEHVAAFVSLDIDQIDQQASALLNKRWGEITSLLPKTITELGTEGRELFLFYASRHWPQGHNRHATDAYRFLNFLARNKVVIPCGRELKKTKILARAL